MTECVIKALEEDRSATKETIPSLRHNRQGGCDNARKLKFEHHLFPLNIKNPPSVPAKFVSYSQTDRPIQHQIIFNWLWLAAQPPPQQWDFFARSHLSHKGRLWKLRS
jgi:hypothetical protein